MCVCDAGSQTNEHSNIIVLHVSITICTARRVGVFSFGPLSTGIGFDNNDIYRHR